MARIEMSLRNILFIVAIVVLLASASVYGVFVLIGAPLGTKATAEPKTVARSGPGPIFSAGTMVVNLSNRDGSSGRVVRAGVAFELDSEKTKRQLEQREEQVKDRIISIVRQQTAESTATNEGLDAVRRSLKESMDELVVEGQVLDVYLFEWVVP